MTKEDISKNIHDRIKQVKRTYSAAAIRAELMQRNQHFLERLKWVLDPLPHFASDTWQEFCSRWGINEKWNGNLENLADYASSLPWMYINKAGRRIDWEWGIDYGPYGSRIGNKWKGIGEPVLDPLQDFIVQPGTLIEANELYVRIFPWTTQADLIDIWPELENAKAEAFGFISTDREKRTFGHALCFYDLHTQKKFAKLSDGKISNVWYMHAGARVKPDTIKKARQRIVKYINSLGR